MDKGFTPDLLPPSKHFWVLQTFERKHLAKVKNDGYEKHL